PAHAHARVARVDQGTRVAVVAGGAILRGRVEHAARGRAAGVGGAGVRVIADHGRAAAAYAGSAALAAGARVRVVASGAGCGEVTLRRAAASPVAVLAWIHYAVSAGRADEGRGERRQR